MLKVNGRRLGWHDVVTRWTMGLCVLSLIIATQLDEPTSIIFLQLSIFFSITFLTVNMHRISLLIRGYNCVYSPSIILLSTLTLMSSILTVLIFLLVNKLCESLCPVNLTIHLVEQHCDA